MKFAFVCKECGFKEHGGNAGMHKQPQHCRNCRQRNWEHLADATPERLDELELTAADVEKHVPLTKDRVHANNVEVCLREVTNLEAKQRAWEANKHELATEWEALKTKLEEPLPPIDDAAEWARAHNERDKLLQRLQFIECAAFTDRDAARLADFKARATAGPEDRPAQHFIRSALEAPGTKEKT